MDINPGFIERYQMIYAEDKSTKLFAPLAEAYRKMGLLKEAIEVCENGIKHHPNFVSGLVAYAKVLIDTDQLEKARKALENVIAQNSDNVLAHSLLAKVLLDLKKPAEALQAYKMYLFLAPNNQEAQRAVKKLESLSARDMDEEFFTLDPLSLFEEVSEEGEPSTKQVPALNLERVLSLADAFSVRGDRDKAIEVLENARHSMGDHPDLVKRLAVLSTRPLELEVSQLKPKKDSSKRIQALEIALRRIEQNRAD